MNLLELPDEILVHIISQLKITNIHLIRCVCKKFKLIYNYIEKRNIWINVFFENKYLLYWNKFEKYLNNGYVFCKFKNKNKEIILQIINYNKYYDFVQLFTTNGNIILLNYGKNTIKISNLKKNYTFNNLNLLINSKYKINKRKGIFNFKN